MTIHTFSAGSSLNGVQFVPCDARVMLGLALNSMQNGSVIIDRGGIVLFLSDNLARLLGLDAGEQVGRHCADVIPGSRLEAVARSGAPELDVPFVLAGRERIVRRLPLRRKGRVLGVLGLVILVDKKELVGLEKSLERILKRADRDEDACAHGPGVRYGLDDFLGVSDAAQALRESVRKAAATDLSVLIEGETGTGKEIVAQSIHAAGARSGAPFIRISCANIPKDLMEAELFGYEGGAFTGARPEGSVGKLAQAASGTVFFDEIGEMPLDMQAKLLTVLEERSFYRLGGGAQERVDFRILSATNRRLLESVRKGEFREDLYYRISTVPLFIPPLRERKEDIVVLAEHFLAVSGAEAGIDDPSLSGEAALALLAYAWPGNVRELSHCLEYALLFRGGRVIGTADLPPRLREVAGQGTHADAPSLLRADKEEAERDTIRRALVACNGHKSRAAKLLGVHRSVLYRKMAALGLR